MILSEEEKNHIHKNTKFAIKDPSDFNRIIDRLIMSYIQTIDSAETGMDGTNPEYWSYEYHNDIAVRDIMERILDGLYIDNKNRVLERLNPLDSRLKKLVRTEPYRSDIIAGYPKDKYWWFYYLPEKVLP